MPKPIRANALALALSWMAACAAVQAADAPAGMEELDTNEAEREAAEEAAAEKRQTGEAETEVVFGDPVDCINVSRIRNTDVLNDREIVFYMHGSEIYVNQLPHRCSGLRMADAFSYKVRTSQLCHVDVIRVLDNFGGSVRQGVACGLGKFLPITEEQLVILRERGPVEDKDSKAE